MRTTKLGIVNSTDKEKKRKVREIFYIKNFKEQVSWREMLIG